MEGKLLNNDEVFAEEEQGDTSLIDPIYRKFVRGVTRAIGSTEFYAYFMDAISCADNTFQFSNRKLLKTVDNAWVDAIEGALESFQHIVESPRKIIKEEELIVNVANARKAGAETVRHLAQHSSLVEDFNYDTGEVRPSRLMQRYREDAEGTYENRLVFTTLELAHRFVKIRHDALLEEMGDEFGAKLKVCSEMRSAREQVHMDMFIHIKEVDSALDTDQKNEDIFNRISRMNRILTMLMNSGFAGEMANLPRMKGAVNKTNILKRSKDYHKIMLLWEFLKSYDDVGYSAKIVEQAPDIDEKLQQDIYHSILFNYLSLKGCLQDEVDRKIPTAPEQVKKLQPKFIKEIIEELVEDYNLPDVEVRKVLIEELTKEQLMQEEAAERLRLVEEREMRLSEEARRRAEEQRIEEELQRKKDEKYRELYAGELEYFKERLQGWLLQRRHDAEAMGYNRPKEDFADAALKLELAEKKALEALEKELRQKEAVLYKAYAEELSYFQSHLPVFIEQRVQEEEELQHAEELRQLARRERMQELQAKQKAAKKGSILKWRRK